MIIKDKLAQNESKRILNLKKWQFKNCCLLTLKDKKSTRPEQIFEFIKSSLYSNCSITEGLTSKNWQIQFKDSAAYNLAWASQSKSMEILTLL